MIDIKYCREARAGSRLYVKIDPLGLVPFSEMAEEDAGLILEFPEFSNICTDFKGRAPNLKI